MHIYFSGIGGVGLGPLAEIALDAGYSVSGSDMNESDMTKSLTKRGADIHIGQDVALINQLHAHQPIDWLVYTSALPHEHPELEFARANGIKVTKRDELLAKILQDKNLELIAISGTHGKTTTTAMVVWLFKQMKIPVSYSVGTTISFGPSGVYEPISEYFVYECDEFDRNFLNFQPFISIIPSQSYDHSDTYPTQKSYDEAFNQFRKQSQKNVDWKEADTTNITLAGEHNRSNAALAVQALESLDIANRDQLVAAINQFPGASRRFEKLAENLYSDYAHHPEEIEASLQLASEISQHIVVAYQPHQNIRQHEVKYTDCFDKAEKIYWLPTFLSREDPALPILKPEDLAKNIAGEKVVFAHMDEDLKKHLQRDLDNSKLVVVMGAGSIDGWARRELI